MLQNLSEKVRLCYQKAADCARQANSTSTEALRADYLRREQSWLKLASSYELQQRISLFIDENRKRANQGMGQANDARLAAGTAGASLSQPSKTAIDRKRLLSQLITIVDDDDCARGGLSALIESRGCGVAAFASAEDYLASTEKGNTTCLILDVHLSGMSGPDLQAHLIAIGCCPPIVFVTGQFEAYVQKQVIEAGALGYLTKPCDELALFSLVEKALGAWI